MTQEQFYQLSQDEQLKYVKEQINLSSVCESSFDNWGIARSYDGTKLDSLIISCRKKNGIVFEHETETFLRILKNVSNKVRYTYYALPYGDDCACIILDFYAYFLD